MTTEPQRRSQPLILVVEDERSFVEALTVGLEREGFGVAIASDGLEALARFDELQPDLVLLDWMLPKLSGVDVCRAIRLKSRTPVIMVTAKTSEIDTVVGLEVGADDYVTKPFRLREVVARIRAVLRRTEGGVAGPSVGDGAQESASLASPVSVLAVDQLGPGIRAAKTGGPVVAGVVDGGAVVDSGALVEVGVVEVGDVRVDESSHEVWVRGELVALPRKEFDLLLLLLVNAGRVLTRNLLIEKIWGYDYVGDTKTLDVHVKRLRSKVETNPGSPTRLLTVRGFGYKYAR